MDKKNIFSIGIGTWKVDYENIRNDIDGLEYSIQNKQNYLSLYMLYNGGALVRSLKEFISKLSRENIFISVNLEPTIEKTEDIEKQLDEYLEILDLKFGKLGE